MTGDNDGIFAEITGDIKEGDKVVTGVDIGVSSISDGQGEANPFMPSPPGARKNAKK